MVKKSITAVLSITILSTLILSGCSGSTKDSAANAANKSVATASTKPVTLRFMWWGSQPRHDATVKVTELYKQKHNNITIESEYQGFDGYYQKLAMMAAANNMPDIFQQFIGAGDSQQFMDKNLIEPLDSYVSNKSLDVSDITDSSLSSGKLNGKLYGISPGVNAKALVVDPDIYKQAGIQVPQDGYANWNDVEKDLMKIKAVTGAYGADDILQPTYIIQYYCRQNGQVQYVDKTLIGFDEKTYVDLYNMKKSWIKQGLIPPLDISQAAKTPEDSQLAKHKAGMNAIYTSSYSAVTKAAGKSLVLIPLPGPNISKGMDIRPGMHISMASTSKSKDEAAKFISFFINDIDANKILNAERGMPTPSKVREALKPTFTPEQKTVAEYIDKVSKNSSPSDPPAPSGITELDKFLTDVEQQIIFEKITPQEGYKQIKDLAAKIIEKNKK